MHSSTSSSESVDVAHRKEHDKHVPVRSIPSQPWRKVLAGALASTLVLLSTWECRMRTLELRPGDLSDGLSAWAEQRRRIDNEPIPVAIVGDSRILFDTDLDRFEALTGIRPLQLALAGTNARPFLEDLAADPRFRGLVIVGITDHSYFREQLGLSGDVAKRWRKESPSERIGYLVHRVLSRYVAFLDDEYRLSTLVERLDTGWRQAADSPYDDVWKISTMHDDRQTALWTRLEHDPRLRDHARAAWHGFMGKPVTAEMLRSTQEKTRAAVMAIRARGGDVVFVRPPSGPEVRMNEERRTPRAMGWDALLAASQVRGIHADDEPNMRGLILPDYSHLSASCATVFTDALVRRLAVATPLIQLKSGVQKALTPADCR